MKSIPTVTPVTTPVPATETSPANAVHVPPAGVPVSVVVVPTHTTDEPVILGEPGNGLTVITRVVVELPQELVVVYVIIAVPPEIPVTLPIQSTMAMPVAPDNHVPPVT